MLTQPVLELILSVLQTLEGFVSNALGLVQSLGAVVIPWPFVWLPYEPFLIGLGIVAGSAGFAAAVKGVRWLYGLVPVIQ